MIKYDKDSALLDYDELQGLLLTHIPTRGELNFWEAENIKDAMLWGMKLKTKDILNTKFICTLHKKMFSNVWAWAGKFRKTNKNIGLPYRLVFIHPFSNGNGRHSRYIADLILDKIFNVDMFTWGVTIKDGVLSSWSGNGHRVTYPLPFFLKALPVSCSI